MSVKSETDRLNSKEAFRKLDIDESGNLDRDELRKALRQRHVPATEEEIERFMEMADKDRDGKISFSEFREFVVERRSLLKEIFDEVDSSHDGHLDAKELTSAFHKMGLNPNRVQIEALMDNIGKPSSGKIEFEEFVDFLILLPSVSRSEVFNFFQTATAIDIGESMVLPEKAGQKSPWKYLAAGGVAGAVSRTVTAPLDRLKLILQIQQSQAGSIAHLVRQIWSKEGAKGFWRGNGANVSKIVPEAGVRFLTFEKLKSWITEDPAHLSNSQRLLAGGFAGIASQISIYPMEVVRTRLAVSTPGTYKGIVDAVIKTTERDGIKGLYRGIAPALLGIFPYAAIDLGVYDILRSSYCRIYNTSDPGTITLLTCGAVSSLSGQLVAYPLDLVRRRLQAQGVAGVTGAKYRGAVDCFVSVVKYEGAVGLYKGMGPNILKVVPAVSISYIVYEEMKRYLKI